MQGEALVEEAGVLLAKGNLGRVGEAKNCDNGLAGCRKGKGYRLSPDEGHTVGAVVGGNDNDVLVHGERATIVVRKRCGAELQISLRNLLVHMQGVELASVAHSYTKDPKQHGLQVGRVGALRCKDIQVQAIFALSRRGKTRVVEALGSRRRKDC